MEYWCRKREYRYSTDPIEYDVEHHEQRLSLPDYSLPHCGGLLAATIANQEDTDVVFHCLDGVGSEEEYYQCQEQQFMTELRSHYPDIAIACASKVASTFMEILRIANASHRCPKRNSGGSSTLHMLYFKIHPRTSLLRQYAEELIVAEGCGDEDEDEDAVFPPRQRPATRASIAALLTAASGVEGDARQCQCGICMEDMETTQRNTLKLPCSHSFHRFCLVQWLDNGHSCPICRYQMPAALYRSDLSAATD